MTALLELCTIVGLLPAGGELCDGVGSTACVCVSQQAGVVRVCCASDSPPQDVARFLEEEIDQHVRISHLQISQTEWGPEFPQQLFSGTTPPVNELVLERNNISHLAAGVFTGLNSTAVLRLSHNQLTRLPAGALGQLPRLQTLVVNNNTIRRLLAGDLAGLKQLRYLSLAENGLERIERGSLPPGLRQLSLFNNRLGTVNGALRNLFEMNWLFVARNRLTSLKHQLPVGAPLNVLTAYENHLSSLDGLQDTPALARLFLHSNNITEMGNLRLPRLIMLRLSHNRIVQVTEDNVKGLPALKVFLLDANIVVEVGPILRELPRLKKLDLSNNRISSLDLLVSVRYPQGHAGTEPHHPLEHLNIKNNLLTSLTYLGLPKLQVLDLSGNRITHLRSSDLSGLHSLRTLVLSGNRLHLVDLLGGFTPFLDMLPVGNGTSGIGGPRLASLLDNQHAPLAQLESLLLDENRLSAAAVVLRRLPALCVLDLRHNQLTDLRWQAYHHWHCRRYRRRLRIAGNLLDCWGSSDIRQSLRAAAANFSMDVIPCQVEGARTPH